MEEREGVKGELAAEQVDHHLVGAHHDGSVGDLPDQVGGEATIQCPVALLSGDRQKCVEEGAVPAALLS